MAFHMDVVGIPEKWIMMNLALWAAGRFGARAGPNAEATSAKAGVGFLLH
jgi:hypothetical protein